MSIQEQCYDNLRVSNNAWDTNLVKVRSYHLSLPPPPPLLLENGPSL